MMKDRTADRRRCAVLVNDDMKVGQLLADSLGPELDVYVVGTIQQACDLFEVLRWVDLAFLDLELPDGSGDELLERLARWPDAIRVLLGSTIVADGTTHKSDGSALKHRHLAHLVLGKPPALPVVQVLKSIVLDLPNA
jgi:CheY-like chemotaxis protein